MFADDGAFAFGSRRDMELGARILYRDDHCVLKVGDDAAYGR